MKRTKVYGAASGFGAPGVKATTQPQGIVEAIVSVFGNVDLQGDVVMPDAFDGWLRSFYAAGKPLPIIFSHQWGEVDSYVGRAEPTPSGVFVTDEGLHVRVQFDMANEKAARVFELVADGRLAGWSFAYDIEDEGRRADGANELRRLRVIEAGPTLAGANPQARTLAAKSGSFVDEIERDVAGLRARVDRLTKGRRRIAVPEESREAFVSRMIAKHGDTDDVREALGVKTAAQIVREQERAELAQLAASLEPPLGTPRTRVRVDAAMRPHVEPSPAEVREAARAEFVRKQLEAEGPIRLAVVTLSQPTEPARDTGYTVVFDPTAGGVVRVPKASTERMPVSGEGARDGHVWRMPVAATSRVES